MSGRRPYAQWDRQSQGHKGADPQQLKCCPKARHQHVTDRLLIQSGISEIPLQCTCQPTGISCQDWAIQIIARPQSFGVRRRHFWIGGKHQINGVTWHQTDQPVACKGHDQQHKKTVDQTMGEVVDHRCRVAWVTVTDANLQPITGRGTDGPSVSDPTGFLAGYRCRTGNTAAEREDR